MEIERKDENTALSRVHDKCDDGIAHWAVYNRKNGLYGSDDETFTQPYFFPNSKTKKYRANTYTKNNHARQNNPKTNQILYDKEYYISNSPHPNL